jgi:heme/copper-type cytochrome/quinol oxidase subunit 2
VAPAPLPAENASSNVPIVPIAIVVIVAVVAVAFLVRRRGAKTADEDDD